MLSSTCLHVCHSHNAEQHQWRQLPYTSNMFQSPNTSTLHHRCLPNAEPYKDAGCPKHTWASSPNGECHGLQSINFPRTDEDVPPDVHRVDADVEAPGWQASCQTQSTSQPVRGCKAAHGWGKGAADAVMAHAPDQGEEPHDEHGHQQHHLHASHTHRDVPSHMGMSTGTTNASLAIPGCP